MKQNQMRHFSRKYLIDWLPHAWKYLLLSLIAFFVVVLGWWRIGIFTEQSLLSQRRSVLKARADDISISLSSTINQKQALLNGLAAYVKTRPMVELRLHDFDAYAAGLQTNDTVIRAIQYLPVQGLILVYPLKGNEAVVNRSLDLLRNDERANVREDVRRTIETRKITLSTPYQLRQGTKGIVARLAVYDQEQFMGLVSVVLDLEPLLQVPELDLARVDFRYAIQDLNRQVFAGDAAVMAADPILTRIELPEGSWTLALAPQTSWAEEIQPEMRSFWLAGLVLALLVAVATYSIAWRQSSLSETVQTQSKEIMQQDQKLRLAVEASGIGFFDWDNRTNKVHYTSELKRQLGYADDEIEDDYFEWKTRLHPDDQEATLALLDQSLHDPKCEYEAEYRLRHKDGSYRWILARGSTQWDADGKAKSMMGCHIDITRQKQNAAALLESEHRFRGLTESSQDIITLYDHECRHVYENPAGLRMVGKTEADLIGKTHREAGFPEELCEMWEKDIKQVFDTGASSQRLFALESSTGPVFLDWRLSPIFREDGQVELVLGISRDITPIKQAEISLRESEAHLRESENRLRFAMEGANDGLWDVDLRNDQVYMSPRGCEILGYRPDELAQVARVWHQLVNPEDLPETNRQLNAHLQGLTPIFEIEQRLRMKSGDWKWVLTRGKLVERGPDGQPIRITGTHTDITERKQAEEKLQSSERTLKLFVEYAPAAIAMFDMDMKYLASSRRYQIDYRLQEQNLIGRSHYEIFPEMPLRWKEIHQRCLAGAIAKAEEDPFPRADGKLDWVRWEIHPWFKPSGEIGGILLFSEVITERKQTQEQIVRLLERLGLATRSASLGVWDWDIVHDQLIWDERMDALYGIQKGQFAGAYDAWIKGLHPDDRQRCEEAIRQALHEEKEYDIEFRVVWPDGSCHWIKANGQVIFGDDHQPLRMVGINYDITERKQSREALHQLEERYRRITESSVDLIILLGADMRIQYVNHTEPGISPEEVIGSLWLDWIAAEDQPAALASLQHTQATGEGTTVEFRALGADRELRWWEVTFACMPGDQSQEVVLISRDITQRKQDEAEITRLADRLALATRAAHMGVWDWDLVNNHLVWDEGLYALYGVQQSDFPGTYEFWLNSLDAEDRARSEEILQQALRGEREYDAEFTIARPDGSKRWLRSIGQVMRNEEGIPQRMIGINYDITERKQAEEALRQRNYFIETILENAPIGFAINRISDGQGTFVSSKFDAIYGVPRGSMNTVDEYFENVYLDPLFRAQIRERMLADMASGDAARMRWENIPITTRTGEFKVITAINIPLLEQGLMISTVQDVTERWHAEEKIRTLYSELEQRVIERTAQLETANRGLEAANRELEAFSYSVSHDLRAPLRGIDGWSLALFEEYYEQLDEKGRQYLERVRGETQRMGQLIDDLLRLSRISRAEMQWSTVNLSEMAHSIAARLSEMQPERVVEWKIEPGIVARADEHLMEVALTNLLSNAFKFTGKLPVASIEFRQAQINGKSTYFIRDNGAGFHMASAKNLFGTFQRMHRQSEFPGTGIGLATVQRIIRRHGGQIWAEAERNAGATFYFTLEEMG